MYYTENIYRLFTKDIVPLINNIDTAKVQYYTTVYGMEND